MICDSSSHYMWSGAMTTPSSHYLVAAFVIAAIGNGLVSGVFFAFSSVVMPALTRVAPSVGVQTMQSINVAVVRSGFLAEFIATTLLSAALVVGPWWLSSGRSVWIATIAGVVSVAGSFGVTMLVNVPLNNSLAVAAPQSLGTASLWSNYVRDWSNANSVRAIAAGIACALFSWAAVSLASEG